MSNPEAATPRQKDKDIVSDNTPFVPNDDATSAADAKIKQSFLLLKSGTAKKLGKQAEGGIGYQILGDTSRKSLYLTITENDGGGYFSREIIPFNQVAQCLDKRLESNKPFPSKLFKDAFVGRSSNNAGFMAALLRNEGLLVPASEAETQHLNGDDWTNWQAAQLALPGELIELSVPALLPLSSPTASESTDVPSERNPELLPSNAPSQEAPTHRRSV